jgi:hypothetical protein
MSYPEFGAEQLASIRVGETGPSLLELVLARFDPFDNAQRGHLAQALVAKVLDGRLTAGWHEYDIDGPDGVRVEVKSTATVQRWPAGQRGYQAGWELPRRRGWNSSTNTFRASPGRWSDVYVLHLLAADACDIDQWCDPTRHTFFVVSTRTIERLKPTSTMRVSLDRARSLAPGVDLSELRGAVQTAFRDAQSETPLIRHELGT